MYGYCILDMKQGKINWFKTKYFEHYDWKWLIYENLSVDENNWAKESPSSTLSVHMEHSQDLESESWHMWNQLKDTDTYTDI